MTDQANNQSASQGGSQSQQASGAGSNGASDQQSQQQSQAPVRPAEFADKAFDAYFDPQKGVKFDALSKDFNDLRAFKAQDDLRRAAVPAKADEYKLALPQTFELPKGVDGKPVEFKFDENDPRLGPVRELAHKLGMDQTGFSQLLAINAQYELGQVQQITAARAAEQSKLGANGPARVDAVSTFLKAKLGSDQGGAIMDRLVLASDVEAMENLVKQFSSQGGGNFSQGGRESDRKQTMTNEQYEKMPLSERRAYQLSQQQPQRTN